MTICKQLQIFIDWRNGTFKNSTSNKIASLQYALLCFQENLKRKRLQTAKKKLNCQLPGWYFQIYKPFFPTAHKNLYLFLEAFILEDKIEGMFLSL